MAFLELQHEVWGSFLVAMGTSGMSSLLLSCEGE